MEESKKTVSPYDKFLNSLLELIYSKEKKVERYVFLLTLIGLILRIPAALNLGVLADDMVHVSQSGGIISAQLLSTHSNPPLFYYLTDFSFKIFGHTTFASRFFPLIFGTLLIPLSFLISFYLFRDKYIALYSAFFVTFSSFLIRMTFGEASLIVLFLSFFGVLNGLVFLQTRNKIYLIISGVTFGISVLTKYNGPFFIISFVLYSLYIFNQNNEKILTKKNAKLFLIFTLAIVTFCTPFLAFNYLIHNENGITDVYFSRVFQSDKTQELYAGLGGQEESFLGNLFRPEVYVNYKLLYKADPMIFIFGLLGFYYLFIENKKNQLTFLGLFILIPFFLQSAGSSLHKHFVFLPFLFSMASGYSLSKLFKKLKTKNSKRIVIVVLAGAMILFLGISFGTPSSYLEPSPTSQLKKFLGESTGSNDLIVFDQRIYAARTFWLAMPTRFTNFQNYNLLISENQKIPEELKTTTTVYFVECSSGDCGWGANDRLDETMNQIFTEVSKQTTLIKKINGKKYTGNEIIGENENVQEYAVYKVDMLMNQDLVNGVSKANSFYFANYMYLDQSNYIFNYDKSGINGTIHFFTHKVILISLVLSILTLFAVAKYLKRYLALLR